MNLTEKTLALREGGQVQRCHIAEYNGPYNVAIHSFNALSLLLMLYPGQPSLELVKAVLWHDVPERWTGDIPAPAKWASPELKVILDKLEERVLNILGLRTLFDNLVPEELMWLKAVDLLELYIWTEEQVNRGNPEFADMRERIIKLFSEMDIPREVREYILYFKWSRSKELHELLKGGIDDCKR